MGYELVGARERLNITVSSHYFLPSMTDIAHPLAQLYFTSGMEETTNWKLCTAIKENETGHSLTVVLLFPIRREKLLAFITQDIKF